MLIEDAARKLTFFSEPRFNRGIAIPCRELGGSSFPDAGLHYVEDSRASLHGGGQNSLKSVDRHSALALGQDDRPALWHGGARQMDGGLSTERSGLEGVEVDQFDVGPISPGTRGQPRRAGADHVAERNGSINQGKGRGIDSGAQSATVVSQDDNVDGYARTGEEVEEDGRLHGLLDQVGLFYEASVGLRVGRTAVTTGSEGGRADGHIQDGPIGKLIGSAGAFGRPSDGGQGDREAHLDES